MKGNKENKENKSNKLVLNKKEKELYSRIVKHGDLDLMFDFGYTLGRERMSRELLGVIEDSFEDFFK